MKNETTSLGVRVCKGCGKPRGCWAIEHEYWHIECYRRVRSISDSVRFETWWRRRNLPNDRRLVRDATMAGLIVRTRRMLVLTEAGKRLRSEGEAKRHV